MKQEPLTKAEHPSERPNETGDEHLIEVIEERGKERNRKNRFEEICLQIKREQGLLK